MGSSDSIPPGTGNPCRFVDMSVKGEQWLMGFYEPAYGNAANMHVERNVFDHLSIESRPVQFGIVRRGVKEKYGVFHIVAAGEYLKILSYCRISECIFRNRDGMYSLFRGNTPGIDKTRNIVALPILQPEGRGRDVGIAVNRPLFEPFPLAMDVLPYSL